MSDAKKIFVDADAFVAINDKKDSSHEKASKFALDLTTLGYDLVTSDPVVGEAVTVISQHAGLQIAIEFAEDLLTSQVDIIEVTSKLRRAGLDIFKKQTSKNSRFTDCINMAIMQEKNLDTIFSFDVQYKQNKFKRFGIDE